MSPNLRQLHVETCRLDGSTCCMQYVACSSHSWIVQWIARYKVCVNISGAPFFDFLSCFLHFGHVENRMYWLCTPRLTQFDILVHLKGKQSTKTNTTLEFPVFFSKAFPTEVMPPWRGGVWLTELKPCSEVTSPRKRCGKELSKASVSSGGCVARSMGVLFGCFARKIDGPGLPGDLIIYQGHLFPLTGHLWLGG